MWGRVPTSSVKRMLDSNIPLTAPSIVTGVSMNKTGSTLRVTWTTPQSDRTIIEYHLQYRTSGTTSWANATLVQDLPLTNYHVLNGLDADTDYDGRVRGVSDIGAGAWSVESTTVPSKNTSTLPPTDSECT